ncbi:hypothetical protein BB560_000972 [Smittium megazygosporum]|uniref:Rad4 beta-hairpin domain-containing protein n=1 Tax=Smittium megazygosporum TaxID=133381 RepID=A0A2T9ZIX7_9FUNG|nr:hypothetical protein BB560_000972 [Smittium megazygosporum]
MSDDSSEFEYVFDLDDDDDDDFEPVSEIEASFLMDIETFTDSPKLNQDLPFEPFNNSSSFFDDLDFQSVEIFFEKSIATSEGPAKRIGISKLDRKKRLLAHKFHLLCLFSSAMNLSKLIYDKEIQEWSLKLLSNSTKNNLGNIKAMIYNNFYSDALISDLGCDSAIKSIVTDINNCFSQFNYKSELSQTQSNQRPSSNNDFSPSALTDKKVIFYKDLILGENELQKFKSNTSQKYNYSHSNIKNLSNSSKDDDTDISSATNTKVSFFSWCEIILPNSNTWKSVDTLSGNVYTDPNIKLLSSPKNNVPYVICIDTTDRYSVKDLSAKFIPSYPTFSKKYRLPNERNSLFSWWDLLIEPYVETKNDIVSRYEEESINSKIHVQSNTLPTKISDFINHPKYAIESQLKKNEILDSSPKVIGLYKGNKVYSRDSVLELFSERQWLHRGRIVKQGENPIKTATFSRNDNKRRKVFHSLTSSTESDTIERKLYSIKQTEELTPPEIVDGRLPRNKFNSIDLFHRNMLPKDTSHIPIIGIDKYCKDLEIDYVNAVTDIEYNKSSQSTKGYVSFQDDTKSSAFKPRIEGTKITYLTMSSILEKVTDKVYKLRFILYGLISLLAIVCMSFMSASLGHIWFLNRPGTQAPEIYVIVLGAVTFVVMMVYTFIPLIVKMIENRKGTHGMESGQNFFTKALRFCKSAQPQIVLAICMSITWIAASVTISTVINVFDKEMTECLNGNGETKKSICTNIIVANVLSWVIFGLWVFISLLFVYKSQRLNEGSAFK